MMHDLRRFPRDFADVWRTARPTRKVVLSIALGLVGVVAISLIVIVWFGLNEAWAWSFVIIASVLGFKYCSRWLTMDSHEQYRKERREWGA